MKIKNVIEGFCKNILKLGEWVVCVDNIEGKLLYICFCVIECYVECLLV